MAERAKERQRLEEEWMAEHRAGKRSQDDYQRADTENLVSTLETEVIVESINPKNPKGKSINPKNPKGKSINPKTLRAKA